MKFMFGNRLATPATRFILLHHHIFKNAGSTLDWILKRSFADRVSFLDTLSTEGAVEASFLKRHLDRNKQVRALSSHQLHTAKIAIPGYRFIDMVFLRHPIDRLRSIYDYYHANDIDYPLARAARVNGLAAFLAMLVEKHPNQVNNVQVNLLANHGGYIRPPDREDLGAARARVRELAIPGLLERFDESLVVAEYFLQPALGSLDLAYRSQHASKMGRDEVLEARLEEMRTQCGSHLYGQLETLNALDMDLLSYVNEEISRRAALVPDLAERLAEYEQRRHDLPDS